MISESRLTGHKFWHHFFTRKMGTFYASCYNIETGEGARIGRLIRYCPICKVDFHEGDAIQEAVDRIAGAPPPTPVFQLHKKDPKETT